MPRELRTTRPLPGSGATRHAGLPFRYVADARRGRKPLIHSGDRSFNHQLRHSKRGV